MNDTPNPTGPSASLPIERLCECGCLAPALRRFVSGHNRRGEVTSPERRAKIGEAQRRAWETKRERKPLGSRRKDVHGYWLVKVREGHASWAKEHILVAEAAAGRQLVPGEHVHHINCIRDDNRPENLVVLEAGAHTAAHGSLNELVAGLLDAGHIQFDRATGRYTRA